MKQYLIFSISLILFVCACSRKLAENAGHREASDSVSTWTLADGSNFKVSIRPWPPIQWMKLEITAEASKGAWKSGEVLTQKVRMGITQEGRPEPTWVEMVKGKEEEAFTPFFAMTSLPPGKHQLIFQAEGEEFTKAAQEDQKFKVDLEPWKLDIQ